MLHLISAAVFGIGDGGAGVIGCGLCSNSTLLGAKPQTDTHKHRHTQTQTHTHTHTEASHDERLAGVRACWAHKTETHTRTGQCVPRRGVLQGVRLGVTREVEAGTRERGPRTWCTADSNASHLCLPPDNGAASSSQPFVFFWGGGGGKKTETKRVAPGEWQLVLGGKEESVHVDGRAGA